jgi:hypothetical protein
MTNPQSNLRLRLTIDVSYDLSADPFEAELVRMHLRGVADFLANRGHLSGELNAIVDEWFAKVEDIV